MTYRFGADIVVLVHFTFILFVLFGALLVVRWRRLAWIHIPVAVWGTLIEFAGWTCPLTPLENWLRLRGGEEGYASSFIEHYILPLVYPAGLTRNVQIVLGLAVLILNLIIYGWMIRNRVRRR